MYLKILQNIAALIAFQNRPSALRREENKVEFLEEQFHNETLSFARKKKLSFLLSFFNDLYIHSLSRLWYNAHAVAFIQNSPVSR